LFSGMDGNLKKLLAEYADRYETPAFLAGDPSWFMHQVSGNANREATAFVAAGLSFGARSQFMRKVQWLLDRAGGDMDRWVRRGGFSRDLPRGGEKCFYRFFTAGDMNAFLSAYRGVMEEFGTLGEYVRSSADGTGLGAAAAICRRFSGGGGVVPKDAKSACKRVCMFLRWMVRAGSPVDLGLWSGFVDRATLAMPLDTHVLRQSRRLSLLEGSSPSMRMALRLSAALSEAFPGDPLRGDFALFGYGVGESSRGKAAE